MDHFAELLTDLGRAINLPLHPDKKRLCQLNVNNLFPLQISDDPAKERLLIAALITDLPPGKFRENILKEALKANALVPSLGTFGFSERNNKLALFTYLPYLNLTGEKIAEFLSPFIDKCLAWRSAIETGAPLPLSPSAKKSEGSIFGLSP